MHFILIILIFLTLPTLPAQAGFEWIPPSENPRQTGPQKFDFYVPPPEVIQRKILPPHQNATYNTEVRNSVRPQSPSLALPNFRPGVTTMTMGQTTANDRPNVRGVQERPVSLYINPYPLAQANTGNTISAMSQRSIEQAMVEQAGRATPMPLGSGMQTGAQIAYDQSEPVTSPSWATPIPQMTSNTPPMNILPLAQQFTVAEGFGSALPLALALSQVIPSNFTHNFAPGVDAGTTVSWQGGKPWNEVLDDMLRPNGLMASINGNAVTIRPLSQI